MSYPVFQVPAGDVLPVMFTSYAGSTGASVTLTGLAVTDIEIYKDGSVTQRSSDAGYTLLDTDGIDFDGITGLHGFSIDTGDNTDAGFYTVGAWFTVVVSAVTVDSQTVSFIACQFRLMAAESIAAKPKVDVDGWLGTAAATPTVAGVPEVDLTHVAGATTDVSALASNVAAILVDTGTTLDARIPAALVGGRMDVSVGAMAANVITAAATAADFGGEIADAVWDEASSGHVTAGTYGVAVTDILTDTAEIGAAGAGLTNINLPDQTMNITGAITGNLSGSVGSVTGAVGSVTGAVGSVTGNVGGNVVGSVASVTARVTANTDQINGVATAAARLALSTQGIVTGTVGAASTTTSIVTSALDPAAAVIDQFKGRIVTFKQDTTTANLRGQSTDITASTALGVLTVTALTTAPASGDTFTIT